MNGMDEWQANYNKRLAEGPEPGSPAALRAEIDRLREALKPFAHYYDLNDCHEWRQDDALEVPIADLLAAKKALAAG